MFYSREINHILEKKNVNFVVDSHLGPIPFELDEMYPLAQSIFPDEIDQETKENVKQVVDRFFKNKTLIHWNECTTTTEEESLKQNVNLDMRRISAVVDMQFGRGASTILLNGKITIIKSKRTGKIRNIICDGSHVISMRANDGLFTLKLEGGRRLHNGLKYPLLRVVATDDAVPFIKEGKSVFGKFVKDCDPELRPFDECLIVNENDTLLAVGRTLLNRDEMLAFRHGMAVKTRESIK
jgi:7-cyano-7-deazaguanine tRNA-ribosyltransferase